MERPILFSGEMVRAILPGWKTNTRRCNGLDKVNESPDLYEFVGLETDLGYPASIDHLWAGFRHIDCVSPLYIKCPYGQLGDRLWVRETTYEDVHGALSLGRYSDGEIVRDEYGNAVCWWYSKPVCPSIHMPRWASRIDLEIKNIRVERLQDISEEDARAEGIIDAGCLNCGNSEPCSCDNPAPDPVDAFIYLWKSINGPESWDENPFVWVIEFNRVRP